MRFFGSKLLLAISYLYSLNGGNLQELVDQKDLAITVYDNFSPTRYVQDIVKKVHRKIVLFR